MKSDLKFKSLLVARGGNENPRVWLPPLAMKSDLKIKSLFVARGGNKFSLFSLSPSVSEV